MPTSIINCIRFKGRAVKAGSASPPGPSASTILPKRSSEQQEASPSLHSPSTFAVAAVGAAADPAPRIPKRLVENAWKVFYMKITSTRVNVFPHFLPAQESTLKGSWRAFRR